MTFTYAGEQMGVIELLAAGYDGQGRLKFGICDVPIEMKIILPSLPLRDRMMADCGAPELRPTACSIRFGDGSEKHGRCQITSFAIESADPVMAYGPVITASITIRGLEPWSLVP